MEEETFEDETVISKIDFERFLYVKFMPPSFWKHSFLFLHVFL